MWILGGLFDLICYGYVSLAGVGIPQGNTKNPWADNFSHRNGMLGTCWNVLELGPAKVPAPQWELSTNVRGPLGYQWSMFPAKRQPYPQGDVSKQCQAMSAGCADAAHSFRDHG